MKKILAVSLCAIMAVSAARADIASVEYVEGQTGVLTNLTTTAKGNLVGAINEVADKANAAATQAAFNELKSTVDDLTTGDNSVGGQIDDKISDLDVTDAAVEKQFVTSVSETDGKITVSRAALVAADIPTIEQSQVNGLTTALAAKEVSANKAASSEAATTIGKTVAYPTVSFMETYVGQMTNGLISDVGDVEELTTENTDSLVDAINEVDAHADAAAVAASNAQLAADAKLATVSSSGSGVVKTVVKDGTAVKVTAGTVALADMAANSVDSSKIVDTSVTKADLATTVQTSLGLADTAMQESALKGLASWTSAKCGTTGVTCSLVSKDGTIAWEAVKY